MSTNASITTKALTPMTIFAELPQNATVQSHLLLFPYHFALYGLCWHWQNHCVIKSITCTEMSLCSLMQRLTCYTKGMLMTNPVKLAALWSAMMLGCMLIYLTPHTGTPGTISLPQRGSHLGRCHCGSKPGSDVVHAPSALLQGTGIACCSISA